MPTFIECFLLHAHIVVRMQHGFPYSQICSVALQQPFAAYMLQSLKLCCSIATTKNSILRLSSTGFFFVVVVALSSTWDVYFALLCFISLRMMMLKCGKNKKVTHEVIAECVTDVFFFLFGIFDLLLDR